VVGADVKVQAALATVTPTALGDRLNGMLTGTPPRPR
jgi:hypothetical protein